MEAGAADAEVAQAAADETERLVATELGHDRAGMRCVPVEQAVLEAAESEEVVLLLEVLDGSLVDRALVARQQLFVGVVLLARHAVLARVHVELDVAGVVAALEQLLDADAVALFGGADEVVVADVQLGPGVLELRGDLVDELLGRLAGSVGGLLDLEAVFVGAGEVVDVVTQQAVPASEGVADDGGVRMTEVWSGVDVVDRGGEEVALHGVSFRGANS